MESVTSEWVNMHDRRRAWRPLSSKPDYVDDWPASLTSAQIRGQSPAKDTLDTDSTRFRYACGKAHTDRMYPPRGQNKSA